MMPSGSDFLELNGCLEALPDIVRWKRYGKVVELTGSLIEAEGMTAGAGDICRISAPDASESILAEVVGFEASRIKLSPLTHLNGIKPGSLVQVREQANHVLVSEAMLGRVLDGLGHPLDGRKPITAGVYYPLAGQLSNPLERPLINEQLDTGLRSINALLPIGKGQRIGIFAGSGVGKSTLLGMMARYTSVPVNVIALVGERGREVNEFLENDLGPE